MGPSLRATPIAGQGGSPTAGSDTWGGGPGGPSQHLPRRGSLSGALSWQCVGGGRAGEGPRIRRPHKFQAPSPGTWLPWLAPPPQPPGQPSAACGVGQAARQPIPAHGSAWLPTVWYRPKSKVSPSQWNGQPVVDLHLAVYVWVGLGDCWLRYVPFLGVDCNKQSRALGT